MVHTGIFATAAQCNAAAGENVDATGWSEANINSWCAMSESLINVSAKYNFSDQYASLNADVKSLLSLASAAWVAMQGINYNQGGFTSRMEAGTMLNVLRDEFQTAMALLRDSAATDYMVRA